MRSAIEAETTEPDAQRNLLKDQEQRFSSVRQWNLWPQLEVGQATQAAGAYTAVLGAVGVIVDNFEILSRFVAGVARLQALSDRLQPKDGSDQAPVAPGSRIALRPGTRFILDEASSALDSANESALYARLREP